MQIGRELSSASTPVLQLDAIGLRYGAAAPVLHGIDLTLPAGSFHFLSGPSGAGKTSLLRVIGLALPPSTGSIRLFGQEIDKLDRPTTAALRQRIGVVFQDFKLLGHLSAFDNVALPLRINGADAAETASFVAEMLGWLGLGDKLKALPDQLSMGQQQMIAIARAVVTKPRLLLADEPTSNIDDGNAARLMNLFIQLHKLGTAVLIATHSQALLARYPYPALVMAKGRLHPAAGELAPPHDLPTRPAAGERAPPHDLPTYPAAGQQAPGPRRQRTAEA